MENVFNQGGDFIKEGEPKKDFAQHDKSWPGKMTYCSYDEVIDPIYRAVSSVAVIHPSELNLSTFLEFDEELDVEKDIDLQGVKSFNIQLEGFETKKKLRGFITTDQELSVVHFFTIPTEIILEHKAEVQDYYQDVKEEIESLCRMIMLEEDEKLTTDAIMLKRGLAQHFQIV